MRSLIRMVKIALRAAAGAFITAVRYPHSRRPYRIPRGIPIALTRATAITLPRRPGVSQSGLMIGPSRRRQYRYARKMEPNEYPAESNPKTAKKVSRPVSGLRLHSCDHNGPLMKVSAFWRRSGISSHCSRIQYPSQSSRGIMFKMFIR